ncbi:hypothetical protein [Streptomyces sp. IBSBF 3136]|uniref:hypothetical protein n=1 Tax=Streptomyces sp. IBSBF 3136 TaxID=2903524 RepID=UPI002FDC517C
MSDEHDSDNVTRLPEPQSGPHWIHSRKINIPLPVLPEHVRQRLRTPGFWTAMMAISAFSTAYASGRLQQTRDVVVALVLTGFVVLLGAVGMVCQAIKTNRSVAATPAADKPRPRSTAA